VRINFNGSTLVYSADTGPTQQLIEFARGADLFVCEAALASAERDDDDRGHMDPDEAGTAAAAAGVGSLLLTHVPAENDLDRVLERARTHFAGPVAIARPGLRLDV
jgi:ribonuclease BN (tRNA processing enzyme)